MYKAKVHIHMLSLPSTSEQRALALVKLRIKQRIAKGEKYRIGIISDNGNINFNIIARDISGRIKYVEVGSKDLELISYSPYYSSIGRIVDDISKQFGVNFTYISPDYKSTFIDEMDKLIPNVRNLSSKDLYNHGLFTQGNIDKAKATYKRGLDISKRLQDETIVVMSDHVLYYTDDVSRKYSPVDNLGRGKVSKIIAKKLVIEDPADIPLLNENYERYLDEILKGNLTAEKPIYIYVPVSYRVITDSRDARDIVRRIRSKSDEITEEDPAVYQAMVGIGKGKASQSIINRFNNINKALLAIKGIQSKLVAELNVLESYSNYYSLVSRDEKKPWELINPQIDDIRKTIATTTKQFNIIDRRVAALKFDEIPKPTYYISPKSPIISKTIIIEDPFKVTEEVEEEEDFFFFDDTEEEDLEDLEDLFGKPSDVIISDKEPIPEPSPPPTSTTTTIVASLEDIRKLLAKGTAKATDDAMLEIAKRQSLGLPIPPEYKLPKAATILPDTDDFFLETDDIGDIFGEEEFNETSPSVSVFDEEEFLF